MSTMNSPILPGATLGVFGSGQLGRMFAIAARRMGYGVHVFSPESETPTGQVADLEICASYQDRDAVTRFVEGVDVVTYEFENVPGETISYIGDKIPVRPQQQALSISQHRIREKEFLANNGIPVTRFKKIETSEDFAQLDEQDFPAIIKTATSGYDGKGQVRVERLADAEDAWVQLGSPEAIVEQVVEFKDEMSVVGVRGYDGEFVHYGPIINQHKNHILDVSILGSELPEQVKQQAVDLTRRTLEKLDVFGVICIEYFRTNDDRLLVNEIAPRPHNSGHLTIDANRSCQFEQQVRTICCLPLGSTQMVQPAAMVNLLGDLWQNGDPCWEAALKDPDVKLHLYGKKEARDGRKMGHMTVLAETAELAVSKAIAARNALVEQVGVNTSDTLTV